MALVGLSDRLVHQPDELSDEQQQRGAIAHTLINEAPRSSANEPIGNLDSHTGEEILRHIGRVRAKMGSWCDTCTAPNAALFGEIEGADP